MKTKELPQNLREEIISSHLDTVGSIITKFKTYGTAANMPGHGRKPNIGKAALVRITKKKPCVTTRHLQDELMKTGTIPSGATIRYSLNKQ
uniref:Uncharacterized protein n=1 Tax=Cyprinus carpio TaxID=7962 RepID=A0A8C1J0Q3_CYPCA